MIKTKNYSLDIAPKLDLYNLGIVNEISDTVAVLDKKSSTITKFIYSNDIYLEAKRIYSISNKRGRTYITSNTASIDASDIIFNNEILYKKHIKAIQNAHRILINKKDVHYDEFFIYSNEYNPTIDYLDSDGNILLSCKHESFPIFINENDKHLKSIRLIDGKKFKMSSESEAIKISYSSELLDYKVNTEDVAQIKIIKDNFATMEPFLSKTRRHFDGRDIDYIYDFSYQLTNTVNVKNKQFPIFSNIFDFGVINVNPESIKINTGSEILTLGNGINRVYLNAQLGLLDLSSLIKSGRIKYGQKINISYSYNFNIGKTVDLKQMGADILNKRISFYITPSFRFVDGTMLNGNGELIAVIFDGTSKHIEASTSQVIETPVVTPIRAIGYSIGGYSNFGYGGIIDPEYGENIDLIETEEIYETGYSYGGYGMGPYGGKYIQSEEDINDFLLINSSSAGLIKTGTVDYVVDIEYANLMIDIKDPQQKEYSYKDAKTYLYPGFLINIGNENIKYNYAAGLSILNINRTTYINFDIVSDEIISLDIPKNPTVEYVDSELMQIFDDANTWIDDDFNIDKFQVFNKNVDWLILDKVIDTNENKMYFKIPKIIKGAEIGIGYNNIVPGVTYIL